MTWKKLVEKYKDGTVLLEDGLMEHKIEEAFPDCSVEDLEEIQAVWKRSSCKRKKSPSHAILFNTYAQKNVEVAQELEELIGNVTTEYEEQLVHIISISIEHEVKAGVEIEEKNTNHLVWFHLTC